MKELLNTGVRFDLEYYEEEDAFIGKIGGYCAAVRENLSTGSYGILMWVKKTDNAAGDSVHNYLEEQQRTLPAVIKNYKVTELGIAAALNRTDDPFVNISNLKRFLHNIADFFSHNAYVNCCCKCGAVEGLGIYTAENLITMTCGNCGTSYRPLIPAAVLFPPPVAPAVPPVPPAPAAPPAPPAPAPEPVKAPENAEIDADAAELLISGENTEQPAETAEAESIPENAEIDAEAAELLISGENTEQPAETAEAESIPENAEIDAEAAELLISEENTEQPAETAEAESIPENAETDEAAELLPPEEPEENEEQPAAEKTVTPIDDSEFGDLMFSSEPEEVHEAPRSELFEQIEREYAAEQAAAAAAGEEDGGEEDDFLDDLLYDSVMDAPEEEPEDVIREEKKEKVPEIVISELLINEGGEMELKKEEAEEDDGTVVTEIHDDSNDGEDIDVTELESLVINPTITTGDTQLEAEDTPLETDGSVPLVNPTANRNEKSISPADGPDAVTPLEAKNNAYSKSQRRNIVPDDTGYATSENMINRDEITDFGKKKRSKQHDAPPSFSLEQERAAVSGSAALQEVNKKYKTVTKIRSSSSAFMGIIGILIFSAVAVAAWTVGSYYINIGFWGALLIAPAVFGGYAAAGGGMDKKGIAVSVIMSLLITFAGVAALTAANVHGYILDKFSSDISFFDSLRYINYYFQVNFEHKNSFFSDLELSYAVTAVMDVIISIISWKKAK